jgi:hypothetical protein
MFHSFGLLVLGALAAVLGVLHAFEALIYLGLLTGALPGEADFFGITWFGAILAGLVAWIWFSVAGGLWKGERDSWEFVVVIALITLLFGTIGLFAGAPWVARAPTMLLAAVALIIALLPATRHATRRPAGVA